MLINLFKQISSILNSTFSTLRNHPIIFLPFIFTAFVKLLLLEVFYFIPQYPTNTFFIPIVTRIWGEQFLHYPANFFLLQEIFQSIQIPITILIGSFFTAMAVAIIIKINNDETINLKKIAKEIFGQYVHIVIAVFLMFLLLSIFLKGYTLIYNRALLIHSTSGKFYYLKKFIVIGKTYFYFLLNVLSVTLTVYILPIIIVDKKKIFISVWLNLKALIFLIWPTFIIILISSTLFIPVLLFKAALTKGIFPAEWTTMMLVLNVLGAMFIDAIIYTAITIVYLSKKEESQ